MFEKIEDILKRLYRPNESKNYKEVWLLANEVDIKKLIEDLNITYINEPKDKNLNQIDVKISSLSVNNIVVKLVEDNTINIDEWVIEKRYV